MVIIAKHCGYAAETFFMANFGKILVKIISKI